MGCTRAEPTMQPAAFSAGHRRALTGGPSPGLSAALRMCITTHHRPMSHGVDLQIFYGSSGHLDDEGALDLFPGLGALDKRQAGVHSGFGAGSLNAKLAFTAISKIPLFGSRCFTSTPNLLGGFIELRRTQPSSRVRSSRRCQWSGFSAARRPPTRHTSFCIRGGGAWWCAVGATHQGAGDHGDQG